MLVNNSGKTSCSYSSQSSSSTSSIFCTNISSCTYISVIFSCSGITCPFYLYFSKTSIKNNAYNIGMTSKNCSNKSKSIYSNTNSSSIDNSNGNDEININGLDYSIRTGVDKSNMLL